MFEVGDLVKVKEDAVETRELDFPMDMDLYRGNIYEVEEAGVQEHPNWYYLRGCYHNYGHWIFNESWLESAEDNILKIEEKEIENLLI